MIFRNPQLLALLALLPVFVALWRLNRARVILPALLLRLLSLALIVVSLADPLIGLSASSSTAPLILAVDQSDSLGEEGRAALRERAAQIAATQTRASTIYYFGKEISNVPISLEANNASPSLPAPDPALASNVTDIAAALRTARSMAVSQGGRVVLLSDGQQTEGDALSEAAAMGAANLPVDTIIYTPAAQSEIWLQSVQAPRTLREGEDFEVEVVISSMGEAQGLLRLVVGASEETSSSVALHAGQNRFRYQNKAGLAGTLNIYAAIEAQPDTLLQNNVAATVALVAPAPRILIVEGEPAIARPLQIALQPLSINTDTIPANRLPTQLSELIHYESIVLLDVPADQFSLDQMASIREFVRSEGRGLLVTGGRSSFTLGGYKDTPLETALPVSMDPPERGEREPVTLLLLIDQSASMGPDTGASKFNMAKEAAILASESLRDKDRIGVLTFDITPRWVIEFQEIGQGLSVADIQQRISRIPLGGGTDIQAALEVGVPALQQQSGKLRHAVLLTDGRSFTNNRAAYLALTEQMRANNMTLSSIAIGSDSDTELLRELAKQGAGRYHFADKPSDIPRLTLLESEILRTEPQVEGNFYPEMSRPHPVLRTFGPNTVPELAGYVATSAKPEAEVVLASPEEDPVLAVWQYGLGRAVAWTPSIEAPWAPNWSNWPEYGTFWAQIIRYTLPEPDSGPLQLRVTRDSYGSATLIADAIAKGQPLDLADVTADITMPNGNVQSVTMRQIAPGRYSSSMTLPSEGPYTLAVRATQGDIQESTQIGYVQGYSAEYLPAQADGAQLMQAISATTGGQVLSEDAQLSDREPGQAGGQGISLWPWLLGLALLLWPLEIAIRRGWLRR